MQRESVYQERRPACTNVEVPGEKCLVGTGVHEFVRQVSRIAACFQASVHVHILADPRVFRHAKAPIEVAPDAMIEANSISGELHERLTR